MPISERENKGFEGLILALRYPPVKSVVPWISLWLSRGAEIGGRQGDA